MGLDDDPLRDQVLLPDSLTVVSIDAVTGRSVLLGVPRTAANFLYPPGSALAAALPEGTRCLAGCGVNHTYQYGLEHPELYPGSADPGADAVREAVSGYTGLPVQATVSIRMTGFVDLIDALGGVSVVVARPVLQAGVPDDGSGRPVEYGPPIPAGLQHLDGSEALWFARSRVNTSDADRSERQGCLQAALFRQADPLTVLTRFQAIARAGGENVSTSLPEESLPALARLAVSAREHPFVRVELGLPLTLPEQPDIDLVHRTVAEAIAGTREEDAEVIEVPAAGTPVEEPAVTAPAQPAATEPACSVP
nr:MULTISPECIES: LCP family protein [unclassified Rathayibacter]